MIRAWARPKFDGKIKLRKGDEVVILAGKDRGRKGKIIETIPDEGKVIVDGVNMVTRHQKPRGRMGRTPGAQLGEIQKPAPLSVSNVQLVCPKCGRKARVAAAEVGDGVHGRKCKKCGEMVD
jgi:large subunit ribosomal protein L24